MLYISNEKVIDEYFESPYLNQSKLKTLIDGDPRDFNKVGKKETNNLLLGSLVDCLLLSKDFNKKYYVSEEQEEGPTEAIKNIILSIYEKIKEKEKEFKPSSEAIIEENLFEINVLDPDIENHKDIEEIIYEACKEKAYYKGTRSKDFYVKEILKEGRSYFTSLVLGEGKTIVSKGDYEKALACADSLKNSLKTKHYFEIEEEFSDNVDIFHQLPIYFKYKGVHCKALLDIVILFYENIPGGGRILKRGIIVDLKTTSDFVLNFHKSSLKYRYDFQQSFYRIAFEQFIANTPEINTSFDFTLDQQFIVENIEKPGYPVVLNISNEVLEAGLKGNPSLNIKGVEEAFENYLYYANDNFTFSTLKELECTTPPTLMLRGIKIS